MVQKYLPFFLDKL